MTTLLDRVLGLLRLAPATPVRPGSDEVFRSDEPTSQPDLNRPKYWAFISYSHYDRRIARWCRDALARQRVPRRLRALVQGGPSHLSSIFLDEESISAAPVLSAELRSALDNSRHLIVICSPFAVASSYVSDEIRYFQSLGRINRILCLVASGVPNAADEGRPQLECFPEPLRVRIDPGGSKPVPAAERPLAAALGDETSGDKARAIRQIAGGMLGVSDAALHLIDLRRKIALGAVVLVAATVALSMLVAFVLPWHTYSRDYARRWGTWQEVDSMSNGTAAKVDRHFEFVRHGMLGKPKSVRIVDGFGRCTKKGMKDVLGQTLDSPCNTSRACEARFSYAQSGDVETEELLDQYGTVLETLRYTDPSVALFTQAGFGCSQSRSGVSYVRFERYPKTSGREAGLDHKVTFWGLAKDSTQLTQRVNDSGAYGIEFEYGSGMRVSKSTLLSSDGKPQIGRDGFASSTLKYDRSGEVIERRFFSPSGEPVSTSRGFAAFQRTLDDYGRILSETYLDLNGKPVDASDGYATVRFLRGPHGEAMNEAYFDAEGHPTTSTSGYASKRSVYDAHGNEKQVRYFDTMGQPTNSGARIAGSYSVFDSWGNPTSVENFGADGKPAFNNDSYVGEQTTYDQRGNPIEHRFLGLKGELIRAKDGWSILRQRFNDHNRRIDVRYFDPLGTPTLETDGYAEWQMEYDENGNLTTDKYLGIDGLPTLDNNGAYKTVYKYNDEGLDVEERYLGLNDRPAATNFGGDASVVRYEYDTLGRRIKESYFDGDGHPAVNAFNFSSIRIQFDVKGRETGYAYFDANGQPAKSKDGDFMLRRQFDDRGHSTFEEYLDPSGTRMLTRKGNAALRLQPDRLGNILTGRHLGLGLEPVLATQDGVAGWDSTFDEKGQQLSYVRVGLDGKPVAGQDQVVRIMYKYDAMGDLIECHFQAADGTPTVNSEGIAGWVSQYNDRHQEVERTSFDTQGKPMISPKLHYATWREKYDDRGRVSEQSYFGLDGHPVLSEEGFAISRTLYDSRGNLAEESFFDETGQPSRTKEAARVVLTYNKYGWQIERRFYGIDNHLIRNPTSGRAIVRIEYDEAGRVTSEKSYDEHEAPVDRTDFKYFKKTTTYDQTGKASDTCTTTGGRVINPCPKE